MNYYLIFVLVSLHLLSFLYGGVTTAESSRTLKNIARRVATKSFHSRSLPSSGAKFYNSRFAMKGEFPYVVRIDASLKKVGNVIFTGVIVSRTRVLTLCQYLSKEDDPSLYNIRAGVYNVSKNDGVAYKASGFVRHPRCSGIGEDDVIYDLGLLFTRINLNKFAQPMRFPEKNLAVAIRSLLGQHIQSGQCSMVGWGQILKISETNVTSANGTTANVQYYVDADILGVVPTEILSLKECLAVIKAIKPVNFDLIRTIERRVFICSSPANTSMLPLESNDESSIVICGKQVVALVSSTHKFEDPTKKNSTLHISLLVSLEDYCELEREDDSGTVCKDKSLKSNCSMNDTNVITYIVLIISFHFYSIV